MALARGLRIGSRAGRSSAGTSRRLSPCGALRSLRRCASGPAARRGFSLLRAGRAGRSSLRPSSDCRRSEAELRPRVDAGACSLDGLPRSSVRRTGRAPRSGLRAPSSRSSRPLPAGRAFSVPGWRGSPARPLRSALSLVGAAGALPRARGGAARRPLSPLRGVLPEPERLSGPAKANSFLPAPFRDSRCHANMMDGAARMAKRWRRTRRRATNRLCADLSH